MIITAMQDLQQGTAEELWMMMGLCEPPRSYSGTKFRLAGMGDRWNVKITNGLVLPITIRAATRQ